MALKQSIGKRIGVTVAAWVVALLIFFPICGCSSRASRPKLDAIAMPPKFLFFNWTLENYFEVQARSNYLKFAYNSIDAVSAPIVVGLLIAVPAAWSMAFAPQQAHQGHPDVDAVDQDDAGGRRAGADLLDISQTCTCSTASWASVSC